jgi:CheY-like chemotaxis protein
LLIGARPAGLGAVAKIFADWGMSCHFAPSAESAVVMLAESSEPVDLILLDAPLEDAAVLRAHLRGEKTPILALTSINADPPSPLAGSRIDALLLKPIRSAVLFEHVVACIGAKSTALPREAPAAEQTAGAAPARLRLLLAEDNEVNRLVLREMLAGLGFETAFAEDGLSALDHFRAHGADFVFMDMMMPHMDGLAAARAIRRIENERGAARVPIVALTAHCADQCRSAAEDAGMDDVLCKPVKREDLLAKIDFWTENSLGRASVPLLQFKCA